MPDAPVPAKPKGGLITFAVTYVLLIASANLASLLMPDHLWMGEPGRVASLALFDSLVTLYAVGTGPGRRTGWRAYLFCGALLPGFVVLLATLEAALHQSYEAFTAGLEVGFRVESPTGLLLWMMEIGLVVQTGPLLRQLVRKFAAS